MRIVVAAAGSRGDAVPFGALAARLQEAGHRVRLLTHESLRDLVADGVPTIGVASDPAQLLTGPAAAALRRGDLRGLNRTRGEFAAFLAAFHDPAQRELAGAGLLIASTMAIAAVDAALERGVPVIRAHLWPENTALTGPMPLLPYGWRIPAPLRRGMRAGLRRVEPYLAGFDGGWVRGRLRLRPHHRAGLTTHTHGTMFALSPLLLGAEPVGGYATGWWTGPPEGGLSAATVDLLSRPGTWLHIGFGSMPQTLPEQVLELVSAAARRVGVRAVVQLPGAEGLDDGTVCGIGTEPHAALFDRVALSVHHGGSGTTGVAVGAGIASVVVPHLADQFWWGHRLQALGLAPPLLPRPLLSPDRLARRIEVALRAAVRRRCAEIGERVRAEDGTGAAVRFVECAVADGGRR
ncbi:glycosyltransferase [Naumannella halotolerans]|uniref:UDP:flavonoid glycosyltransferase YjiC (YdhE family) n=1 Tax=Naumannella halotolerans TaxID=993414 RepID=A0A4R7J3S4_9ACTN|nr:glycosyltransferase [Naumannella halotolerans]TDT31176.1 UDP:flavonoid glycosyltransferase YjiC (YdhE family) [Naumannella halotolerans]